MARMKWSRLPRRFLTSWVRNKRPVGRPQFHYGHGLVKDLRAAKIRYSDWHIEALDWVEWRRMVG